MVLTPSLFDISCLACSRTVSTDARLAANSSLRRMYSSPEADNAEDELVGGCLVDIC